MAVQEYLMATRVRRSYAGIKKKAFIEVNQVGTSASFLPAIA
mgnify:CR=1 FL=1